MINASIDMLNHLGHTEHAKVIYDATYQTIVNDAIRTPGILLEFIKFFGITIFIYFPFISLSFLLSRFGRQPYQYRRSWEYTQGPEYQACELVK